MYFMVSFIGRFDGIAALMLPNQVRLSDHFRERKLHLELAGGKLLPAS